jgi:hypothetical protein
MLLLAALVTLAAVGREGWFWGALLGFHLGLAFLLATGSERIGGLHAVWPRRVLVLSFVAVVIFTTALRARGRAARVVLGLLVVGSGWQLVHTIRWAATPLYAVGRAAAYPLPSVHTPVDDRQHLDSKAFHLLTRWFIALNVVRARPAGRWPSRPVGRRTGRRHGRRTPGSRACRDAP